MAADAPTTGALTGAPSFTFNGTVLFVDGAQTFLEQAHGVVACLEDALEERNRPLNPELLQSAARAVGTLLHLTALALHNMEQRRAAVAS